MPDLLILGLSAVGKTTLANALREAGCTATIFEQVFAHEGGAPKVLVNGQVRQALAVCSIERVNVHVVQVLLGDTAMLVLTCVRNGLLVPTDMRFTLSDILDPAWASWPTRAANAILGLFPDLRQFSYDPKAILRASLVERCPAEGEAGLCFHRPDGTPVAIGEMIGLLDQNHPDALAFLEDVTGAAVRAVATRSQGLGWKGSLAYLEAILANERGKGEGPSAGWSWFDSEAGVWIWRKAGPAEGELVDVWREWSTVSAWDWAYFTADGAQIVHGSAPTAREAMNAADLALLLRKAP